MRDLYETETASFWKDSPEVTSGKIKPQDIKTEVFLLPAAAVAEMDGSFTNTQRLVQWHDKAADPPDDARSDVWFTYHLGRRLKKLYADSKEKRDRPILALTWDYMDDKANSEWRIKDEPSAELILKEISGYTRLANPKGKQVGSFADLKDDGTTACGAWIYTGHLRRPRTIPKGSTGRPTGRVTTGCRSTGAGRGRPIAASCTTAARRTARAAPGPRRPGWPTHLPRSGGTPARGYVYWDRRPSGKEMGRPRRARLPGDQGPRHAGQDQAASASKRTTAPRRSS